MKYVLQTRIFRKTEGILFILSFSLLMNFWHLSHKEEEEEELNPQSVLEIKQISLIIVESKDTQELLHGKEEQRTKQKIHYFNKECDE